MSFRGHLSRPACSHVKQLAKQAGDKSDPGRTYRSGRIFYGLISGAAFEAPRGIGITMVKVQSVPALHAEERSQEADHPSSKGAQFGTDQPLRLDCGIDLAPFQIAYQTYGELNAERSNAILVCHALTGDQHVANVHPVTGKPGWWETLVGPGRPLDIDRYFIICTNVIGGCMGSTGPASINPATGKLWGLDFPVITIPDMVRAQAMLLDRLDIETLFCVVGGSMGGMQALQLTAAFPKRVFSTLAIACSTRHSAQNIAFHELGRQAVMADPDWHNGRYFEKGTQPHRGLGVARMAAHITYLSDAALHRKFGRRMQDRDLPTFSFDADFQVESYLRYQGSSFVERFDANSYLYLTRAMDYFDIAADHNGVLARAFRGVQTRFCVVSFTSDWLFPTSESRALVHALNASGARVSFAEIETDRGHDAFLLDVPEFFDISRAFLQSAAKARGLSSAGDT
jgi:homoserine O-acetyltransferase